MSTVLPAPVGPMMVVAALLPVVASGATHMAVRLRQFGHKSMTIRSVLSGAIGGAAAIAAITADEIIDLEHSVDPAYRQSPKARFMFNDTTLKTIRKLKDGQGQYLWNGGDLSKGISPTLLGYNYSINQAMASPATGNKTVIFGDHSKYFVRKVGAPIIGVMRERFWPDLGIAGLIRLDGELADTAAVIPALQQLTA